MNYAAEALGVGVIALSGLAIGEVLGNATAPERVSMGLVSLSYEDGHFTQVHEVRGVDFIKADWSAQIIRGETPICGGGGMAPYGNGAARKVMDPNTWTGGVCPELKPGDRAIAAWEWTDNEGLLRRIYGEIVIP